MNTNLISVKILACLLIICSTCGLSCRRKAPPADVNRPAPAPDINQVAQKPTTTTETGPNSAAVTINGIKITEGEIDKMVEPQLAAMAKQGQNPPPEYMEQMKKLLRQRILEGIIAERLINEKAKQANIAIADEDVSKQLEEIASMQRPLISLEDFKKKMESLGQSFDEVKHQVRVGMTFQKIMEAEFADKINITENDAKQYYDQNQTRYKTPEQVKASHILIKPDTSDPNTDPNQVKAMAKAKAEELLKQIKAGADFAEVAKANSDCPSATQGGDLGFFSRGKMVPPFEKAAFELEVNQVSDIVETNYGYHIIKATDHKDASVTTFEQAKDDIITQLTQRRQRELAAKYIESLKAEANIVYPPGKEPQMRMPSSQPAPPPRQEKPVEPQDTDANNQQLR